VPQRKHQKIQRAYSPPRAGATCSLTKGGAMIIAVAKASAEIAKRAAAPSTGHIRALRSGRSNSALA
jgi:hypothetical protein